jgi:hypothetical protein
MTGIFMEDKMKFCMKKENVDKAIKEKMSLYLVNTSNKCGMYCTPILITAVEGIHDEMRVNFEYMHFSKTGESYPWSKDEFLFETEEEALRYMYKEMKQYIDSKVFYLNSVISDFNKKIFKSGKQVSLITRNAGNESGE